MTKKLERQIAELMRGQTVTDMILERVIHQLFSEEKPDPCELFGELMRLTNADGVDRRDARDFRVWAGIVKPHCPESASIRAVSSKDSSPR